MTKDVTVRLGPGLKDDAEAESAVARATNWLLDEITATSRPMLMEWDRDTTGGTKGLLSLRLSDPLGSALRFFSLADLTTHDPTRQAFTRMDLRGVYSALLRETSQVLIRKLLEPTDPEPEERPALATENAHREGRGVEAGHR